MMDDRVIVPIALWNTIQIYFFAIVFSFWICAKTFVRWIWNYNTSTNNKIRNSPPPILVDATIGRHSYVKVQGVKLHYVEAGDRGSPPILLLHGFPDCWVGWRDQLPVLASSHHVLALDLLGCGDSDKPASRIYYSPAKVLGQLKAVLEGLAAQPPHRAPTVIAHDLGGLLAWYLAHECPELIERLVIVSSPHPNIFWDCLQPSGIFNSTWMYTAQVPYLAECEALRGDLVLLNKCHSHLQKKTVNGSSATLLEAYKYVFSRRQDWTGPINYFRNFIFWRITEDRGKVKIPILLVTGNKDAQVTLECMVRSSEWCSQANLKIVEGAGHFPHQESPQYFNRLLTDFLITDKIIPVHKSGLAEMGVDAARGLVGRVLGAVHLFT